jgi:hypothetical protein
MKTPYTHQLLNLPAGFTAFNVWQQRGWWWEQAGQLTTAELEQVFGVPHRDSFEPPAQEMLLFTLGSPETIETTWGLTRWLRVASIASVLCSGWLLWWFTRGERLIWMLGIGFLLMGMAFVLPELILTISQSLAWGLLLLAGSLWSYRWQRLPVRSRTTIPVSQRGKSVSGDSRSSPTSTVALALQERRS